MTAELLKGGPVAAEIREGVAAEVVAFVEEFGYTPELAIVVVGADAPSMVYLERILKGCDGPGFITVGGGASILLFSGRAVRVMANVTGRVGMIIRVRVRVRVRVRIKVRVDIITAK